MYKKILLSAATLCFGFFAQAQDENDALLLGRTYQYGTARNLALSGATGSLGADFGGIGINPAGLGLFRSSELSFTPTILVTNTNGEYTNTSTPQSDARFNFNQAGVVIAKSKTGKEYSRSKWKTSNFAVGFNRLANLHSDYSYSGQDNRSSFVENFAEEINSLGGMSGPGKLSANANDFSSDAAYGAFQTFLIDNDPNDSTKAFSFVPYETGLRRSKTVRRQGGINELAFSYGANYQEKLLIGVSLGIPIISLSETEILTEDDLSGDPNNDFDYVDLVQNLSTEGSGVNLKFGAIYKPTNSFRFGLALHTPTWYSLTDVSNIIIESNTENLLASGPVTTYTPDKTRLYEYSYSSPMKAIVSGTVLFGKQGFLSADVEWVNYKGMRYNYGSGYQAEEIAVNRSIQNAYQNTTNVRLGGELRVDQFALRAGAAHIINPARYVGRKSAQTVSLGIGYRSKSFFLDLAGQYMRSQDSDLTHTLARTTDIPQAIIATNNTQISMTAGFRF